MDAVEKVLRDFTAQAKAPRRVPPHQYYQRHYYDTQIKAVVDHEFKELCAKAKATNSPLPQRVHVLNQTAKRLLEEESPEFQAEMAQRQEAEYVADTEAFAKLSSMSAAAPCTPEDFDRYVRVFSSSVSTAYGYIESSTLQGSGSGRLLITSRAVSA